MGQLIGFAVNIGLQILLYRWITIRFILKGKKEAVGPSYYAFFVAIALVVYFLLIMVAASTR